MSLVVSHPPPTPPREDVEMNPKFVAQGSPDLLRFTRRLKASKRNRLKVASHPSQSAAAQGEKRHPVDVWAEPAQGEQRLELVRGQTHAVPFRLQLVPAARLTV